MNYFLAQLMIEFPTLSWDSRLPQPPVQDLRNYYTIPNNCEAITRLADPQPTTPSTPPGIPKCCRNGVTQLHFPRNRIDLISGN